MVRNARFAGSQHMYRSGRRVRSLKFMSLVAGRGCVAFCRSKRLVAMSGTAAKVLVPLFMGLALAGCSKSQPGPASVAETSSARANIGDRVRFIENYVTFRRTYEKLDYDIAYQNNGGGLVPAPSDWDIRLIASVPKAEMNDWVPVGAEKTDGPSPEWLKGMPGSIEREGITEWYRTSGTVVGLDRERSIVAYRNTSMPE
jgi:hypothetical protein